MDTSCIIHQCRDAIRSRGARFNLEALDQRLELKPADPDRGPERARERGQAKELLWRALSKLGEDHREIIVLKELEGFRYGEIAGILSIPEGPAGSTITRNWRGWVASAIRDWIR